MHLLLDLVILLLPDWVFGRTEDITSHKLRNLKNEFNFFELKIPDLLSELFEAIFFLQGFMLLLCEKYNFRVEICPLEKSISNIFRYYLQGSCLI